MLQEVWMVGEGCSFRELIFHPEKGTYDVRGTSSDSGMACGSSLFHQPLWLRAL